VVATCPHCVNSLLQDYPDFGADLEVVHHTQLVAELIDSGRITLPPGAGEALLRGRGGAGEVDGGRRGGVAYHDPCYLARVGGVTEAPRQVLRAGLGEGALVELGRSGRNTSCCGAGGGRMWFDDGADTRVGRSRVDELAASGAATVAVSCPFCHSMVSDGIAARDAPMAVKDVAEIVAEALDR
jgi:Fe-S oxidoreductase